MPGTKLPNIQKLSDQEKATLLHDLLQHYTGPTEAMVTSLKERLNDLRDVVGPPDAQERIRQAASAQAAMSLQQEQDTFNYAVQALITLGARLENITTEASNTLRFAMEIVTQLACRKLGYVIEPRHLFTDSACPSPGSPAPPPAVPPCPGPKEASPVAEEEGDSRGGSGPG